MKIAYLQGFFLPAVDGPGQAIYEIGTRLAKEGHEVHVYCSDSDKYKRLKKKYEVIDGLHVHRCFNWFTLVNFATFWPSVFPKLLKNDFDIIHSHVSGHAHVLFSGLASMVKKIPHVHTTHCCWTTGFRSKIGKALVWLDYKTVLPLTYKLTDKIIAITPWEIEYIKKYGGKSEQIEIIPNGVDKILFKPVKNNAFRKRLGIPKNAKLVLFFGRLNPTKGPDKLALAGLKVLKKRKDVYFVFVGPDEGMKQTVAKIIKNHKNMILLEPIRDKKKIAEMYQAADIYCLPSYREGLPLTLFEAMASGLPIVASPVNGVPYEMKEPENGYFVKYGDINGLVEAITKLLDNKQLMKNISKNNKKKAKAYDWDIIAEKTFKVYKDLVSKYKK